MSDDGLKVGDLMVLHESSWGNTRSVVPVVRLTPTRITVRDGSRERQSTRRHHAKEIGRAKSSFYSPWLTAADDATLAEIKEEQHRRELIARIEKVGWKKLTTAQLEAIVAALPAVEVPA